MTTPAAERLYEAQHLYAIEGKKHVVYNPHNKPVDELPEIFCLNNGGRPGWYNAVAVAEDGTPLGSHACSSEAYMPHDLGMLEGCRLDRHENSYSKHYPDGYRMTWIPTDIAQDPSKHSEKFAMCVKLNAEQQENEDELSE